MTKYTRLTGKVFGSSATGTGDDPEIGQFGSALAGTYNGTTDVATIQSLPAWQKGFIGCVTPNTQFPPLPEMTGFGKVLSEQICYLLQQGVAEWDSGTTYYENNWCAYQGKLYISKSDENLNNLPTNITYWTQFTGGSSRELGEIVTSSLPITNPIYHLADGSQLSSVDYPELFSYIASIYSEVVSDYEFSEAVYNSNLGNNDWNGVAFGNNKYVAIGQDGYISTSTDGINWSVASQNSTLGENNWTAIAYGNNKFVAVTFDKASTSTDGINWAQPTDINIGSGETYSVKYLTFDGTKFIAFPSSDEGGYYTSLDGITWTKSTYSEESSSTLRGFIYGNGKYVMMWDTGEPGLYVPVIRYSTDLTNWTTVTASQTYGSTHWQGIGFNGQYFIITSPYNSYPYTAISQDGISWTRYNVNTPIGTSAFNQNKFGVILTENGYTSNTLSVPDKPFITEADWQQTYTTYGECGKYVYNAGANTLRLPLYNSYLTNTTDPDNLGDLTPASIPNITGTFGGAESYNEQQWNTGAFYSSDQNTTLGGAETRDADLTHFDASRVSSVYSNSATTVNTQSVKQLVYIVVAK